MVQINFAQRSVNVKIVYYGPGMSGKTTNLEIVHQRAPESNRGELTSISTDGDRTLFFDFMPLDLGTVAGMRTQFQLYTVPGQVYYNSTRKLVLQGVDGVIFIADSSAAMLQENLESLRNLQENLIEYGKSLESIPWVIQYNKRDLPDALSVEELQRILNPLGVPAFEGVANTGQGVFPTLKALAARVLESIHSNGGLSGRTETPAARAPAAALANAPGAIAPSAQPSMASTGFHPQAAIPRPMQEQPAAAFAQPAALAASPQAASAHPGQNTGRATPSAPGLESFGSAPTGPAALRPGPVQSQPMPTSEPSPAQPLESTALRLRAPLSPNAQGHAGGVAQQASAFLGGSPQAPQARSAPAPTRAAAGTPPAASTAARRGPTPAGPAPAPAAQSAAPRPDARIKPRTPQPTPKGGGSKTMAVAGIFLGLALVAGVLLAKFVFNLF